MLKKSLIYIVLSITISISYAQLSPGDLSNAHAKFEGMSNCTLCHDLGKKVSSTKCLDCHKEIQNLRTQNRGYHANSTVKVQECFACHSDHHGRKFDMVRFNEDEFDHKLTAYRLDGKHASIDCRDCHTSENIGDRELKKRSKTFLGLDDKCLSCHDNFHQNTLSDDCIACHTTESFRPAPKFDHDKADFRLLDKHKTLDCKECHKLSTRNGVDFQAFADVPFNDCAVCHSDPHDKHFVAACAQCHTEKGFALFSGRGNFNHNTTQFTLKGKHASSDCFVCHKKISDPLMVFQDQPMVKENDCVSCHTDKHEGKFGTDCAKCHQEVSFRLLKTMDFFDHAVTDFPLDGMHGGVDCAECHADGYLEAIDFSACKNCHQDYHRGEFLQSNASSDCIDCHSLADGFDYSLYTIDRHQTSAFPIEGAHVATPCFACHVSEDRWNFRDIGSSCVDCHQDLHQGHISPKFYPEQNCESCHVNENWTSITFDHNLTEWPLEGRHEELKCGDCHIQNISKLDAVNQRFNELDNSCVQCHPNIHTDNSVLNEKLDCSRCHDTGNWMPRIDHNQTAFPLEGAHVKLACNACHETIRKEEKILINYKIEKFECVDCHH